MTAPLIYVLNGPNINFLGIREPEIYGTLTMADVKNICAKTAEACSVAIDFRQSNHEGVLVDWIQEAHGKAAGIVLNAGAYTHTSIAILDALRSITVPCIEVHLTNVQRREPYRHQSYLGQEVVGIIAGFGGDSYRLAIDAMAALLKPGR
jgi:3-dehydroquinate dehydratase-2